MLSLNISMLSALHQQSTL
ncbi:unnamed protein product, partial [Vitis vinifera]|uniref:Uncharacterized protein n=1 Tax=Vitis vinifera TaxID=29760 RepID=D7SRY2_VITVI